MISLISLRNPTSSYNFKDTYTYIPEKEEG